ncbi:MAG: hypothetical protein JW940_22530, partial [Polyangiaceae bacterium]|nr:hypothetical protein [Polyangiaceae bacterium]
GPEASRRADNYVVHPRRGKGYSRRSVLRSQEQGQLDVSRLVAIRDTLPSDEPLGSLAGTVVQERAAEGTDMAADPPQGGGEAPRRRIESVTPDYPYVEVQDDTGGIHRLQLDGNQSLYYTAPGVEALAVDRIHRVTAFNLAIDLNQGAHIAWFEMDTGQLYYVQVVVAPNAQPHIAFRTILGKPGEPEDILVVLAPQDVTIKFGAGRSLEYVRFDPGNPAVKYYGRS